MGHYAQMSRGDPVKSRLAGCTNLLNTRIFRANESKVVPVNVHAKPVPNVLPEKYQINKLLENQRPAGFSGLTFAIRIA